MSRIFQQYKSSDEPVPGYRLIRFLGKGNFGEVWMASAPGNKKVALKIIDLRGREGLQESKAIERIKDINHAHLVSIFAYWVIDADGRILDDQSVSQLSLGKSAVQDTSPAITGTMYLDPSKQLRPVELIVAMSLGSKNLSDLLDEFGKQNKVGIPVDSLLDYMEDAAKGLDYLNLPIHDLGKGPMSIIHGDVKPQNLLIVGNSLQICDFGLARGIDELRKTATAMGSFAYAAPELLDGHPHVRSDQYCLAVSYIELRTGALPLFGQTNILKIAELHRDGKLDLSGLGPGEAEVIRKATNPDPQQRWASCRDMVRQLRVAVERDATGGAARAIPDFITSTRKLSGTDTSPPIKPPARRSWRFVVAAVLVLFIGGLAAAAIYWDRWWKPVENDRPPPDIAKREEPPAPIVAKHEELPPPVAAKHEELPTTIVDRTQKPPMVEHVAKPPVVEHIEKPPVVVKHVEKQPVLEQMENPFLGSAVEEPPVVKHVEKPPAAPLLIADARAAFLKGQLDDARKKLAAAREALKATPSAEQSRQVRSWEAVIAICDPATTVADRLAAADAIKTDWKSFDGAVRLRIVDSTVSVVRGIRQDHASTALFANPFGDAAAAEHCYKLLNVVFSGIQSIEPNEQNWSGDAKPKLRFNLAAAAVFQTEPDLTKANVLSSAWADRAEKDAFDPADAELAWYIAVCSRVPPLPDEATVGAYDRTLVEASIRLLRLITERFRPGGENFDAETATRVHKQFLQPVLAKTDIYLSRNLKADERSALGEFYTSVYDYVLQNRDAVWPATDRAARIDSLLNAAIELKAEPLSGKFGEPTGPVADATLRRLYRDRAQRSLTQNDPDLDRTVADGVQAGASDLLTDALVRRAATRTNRAQIVDDLNKAVEEGKMAKTAHGLTALSVAYVLRAAHDNHPAYSREAREQDLDAAVAGLQQAAEIDRSGQGTSANATDAASGAYLYHLAAGRAREDLACLADKDPAANINQAVREYAAAAKINSQSPQPLCAMGRCYFRALDELSLPPDALQTADGGPLQDQFQVMDECERTSQAAINRDSQTVDAVDLLARLNQRRAVAYYGQFRENRNDSDSLAKAKDASAKADEHMATVWTRARKQSTRNWDTYAARWAESPINDIRYTADKEQGSTQRHAEVLARLDVLKNTPPPPGRTAELQRAAVLIRGRLAESENKYEEAVQVFTESLPQDLAKARSEDVSLLLARAFCHMKIATKRMPSGPDDRVKATDEEIQEAERAAADAAAAGRLTHLPGHRVSALEQAFLAHAFVLLRNDSDIADCHVCGGLDELTSLRKLKPRRPQEYSWCATWARVAWAQVQNGAAERSERLKNYSAAIDWAARAVELCQRKQVRDELSSSLLKPYTKAALKYADEQLGKSPPPNPPFSTDLKKKRDEWKKIAAGVP